MRALLAELARVRRPPLRHEALVRLLIAGAGVALALLVAILWMWERRGWERELWRQRAVAAALEVERDVAAKVVAWSPDGRLVRGRADGIVEVAGVGGVVRRRCGGAPIVAVASAAEVVAAADSDGAICLWRGEGAEPRRLSAVAERLTALALDAVGSRALVGDRRGGVQVIDVATGARGEVWPLGGDGVLALRVVDAGALLAVTRDGRAYVGELRGLELRERIRGR
jgi:hypothetical protein